MVEAWLEVDVEGGVLGENFRDVGEPWALVSHGGPGLPDSMGGCVAERGELCSTIRYTQRGTAPGCPQA